MKKILLILVGGTICCEQTKSGALNVGENADLFLINGFKNSDSAYVKDTQFTVSENLYILSENLTVNGLNRILNTYKNAVKRDSFDGVIFAHGTDTLAFCAAIFAQVLRGSKIPVFFVSAQKPLSNPDSNGHENFRCAVECIARGITQNVWVTYKNISDGKMYLHSAFKLKQCENYSDDFFSHGMIDVTRFSEADFKECFENLNELAPKEKVPFLEKFKSFQFSKRVLLIEAYVGIDYSAYNLSNFAAVLHTTYHSGTACATASNAEDSLLYLLSSCEDSGVDVYLSPAKDVQNSYQSIVDIAKNKTVNFLYGLTKETAYAKLLVAYSLFDDKAKIQQFITEINDSERVD
ncbi:MAG: asparaginase [Clostridia bacterium]|nr:asparaginase [Clostridia bacterium]